jgi:long-subunit acyl-CoA synthetase (AMP-forming)
VARPPVKEEIMPSSTVTPPARAVEAATVTEALRRTAASHPDGPALRTVDDGVSLTWSQVLERAEAIAGGLAGLGVCRGDAVAIMLSNRIEFHLVDLAAAMLGATPFSIYTTYPPEEIRYLIEDAGARVAVVERDFLEAMQEARRALPGLQHVIIVDGDSTADTVSLSHVEGSLPDFDVAGAAAAVSADDILTLIYTSGTTGRPKGVELTHGNVMAGAAAVEQIISLDPGSRVISWLPAAHIAERMAHHYIPLIYAGTVTICPNPREIVSFLPQVRPTWFFAVPRIWEKLKSGLETMQAAAPEEQRQRAEQALSAATQRVRLRQRGEPVPEALEAAVAQADAAMFAPLRAMLGLDQVRAVNVGAAPTPIEVLEFFHALGIEVAELWGMSETCGCGLCNRPGEVRIGAVGPPSPGAEVKLAGDGELLVRGAFVMPRYRHQPEKTAETLDRDGWLHTGDIAEIDEDGFVRIVDRKKELIINAAGKNMSPANIEATIKTSSPLIGQACCIGDARPYNTALILLDADFAPVWAQQQGIEDAGLAGLAEHPRVREAVQAAIDEANRHLARVEQIKKFALVGEDWLPGGDELTPTMKLKRRPIAEKYASRIEAMYAS